MRYIVHLGTGTVIDADECVIVDLPEDVIAEMTEHGGDDYFDDNRICELAEANGDPINTSDVSWRNSMSFSPSALRDEANELLEMGTYDSEPNRREALEWCAGVATDTDLNSVASYILDDDDLWTTFRISVIDGLTQGLAWSKEIS